uniref:Uncharacterized protein n=1 Tax=Anguilla anguilla TaxID=7936 RepID=A0A0E9S331_ANGAN
MSSLYTAVSFCQPDRLSCSYRVKTKGGAHAALMLKVTQRL